MTSPAMQFLHRLFDKGQRARSRGQSEAISLRLTRAQCPEYFDMRRLEDAQVFRGELNVAARAGAIAIDTAPRLQPPRDVEAIRLLDLAVLAAHLGIELRSVAVAKAIAQLRNATAQFPVLNIVLERWHAGSLVRRGGPGASAELADAVQVVRARQNATQDVLLRRESIRLFGDSKRIAAIAPWIDLLLTGELRASTPGDNESLASLGLLHEPQPWLAAGLGTVVVSGEPIGLAHPYLGLPAEAIESFSFPSPPRAILTVENKQSFHEAARQAREASVLVVYTGGMPSPAWRAAYAHALRAALRGALATPIYHFGDLDVGGLRIAATLAKTVRDCGGVLLPWQMLPVEYVAQERTLHPIPAGRVEEMARWARAAGWDALAQAVTTTPGTAEQEGLQVRLP